MSRWPMLPLLQACQLTGNRVIAFVDVRPYVSTGGVNGNDVTPLASVAFDARPSRADLVANDGDILFARMQATEKVVLVTAERSNYIWSTGFAALRPKQGTSSRWVAYWLQSQPFQERKNALCTGATQKAITNDAIRELSIPLPPLPEQNRLIQILDEADQLRRLRAEADRRTADLIPALFHEMFGNPFANPKGWPILPLKELSEKFSDGPFGSNLKSEHYVETGVRLIRLQNIGVGDFIDEDKAYISESHFRSLIKHQCLPGDVIVGTLGEPNLRACILPDYIPQALNKADCIQIRPQRAVATAEYICWLLNMPSTLQMSSGLIMGQTRSRISMGRLAALSVPIPPFALQQSFSARVAEVHDIRGKQAISRKRNDDLFESVLHLAFQGDL